MCYFSQQHIVFMSQKKQINQKMPKQITNLNQIKKEMNLSEKGLLKRLKVKLKFAETLYKNIWQK